MILTTNNLSKRYGSIQALKDVSLNIEKGNIYGILGPNGSGKTTTLGILMDIIPKNSGTYQWFDEEPTPKSRKKIGALVETPNFYEYLSGERNLKITASIKGVDYSDIERVLKFVNLYERRKDAYKGYSLGMKQRLAIAGTLLGKPEVLVLDEPTNGLDPQGISEIRELILKVATEGITVILASHMLDEVEKVCSHVAILKKGELLAQGTVDEILGDETIIELKADDMEALRIALEENDQVAGINKELDKYVIKLSDKASSGGEINKYLFDKGIVLTHFNSKKKNLEKQFLEITN